MADDHLAVYEALLDAQRQGISASLATIIATNGSMPRHIGSKMLVYADGQTIGTVGGGAMEARVIEVALLCLQDGQARTETLTLNSLSAGDPGICGGSATIFIEPLSVAPTLIVVGAGHVGKALAELGKWAGFRVILSDDRPEYANDTHVKGLDRYLVCSPDEIIQHVTIDHNTYIAATTRGLPVDKKLLPALLGSDAAYIGLIGSRRRWAITMKILQEEHHVEYKSLQRIYAPIGLEIEAESPHEIAVSIIAEIIMVRRGGTGAPMRWHGSVKDANSSLSDTNNIEVSEI